jgi:pantoate--beta-alanine ligase
LIILDTKEDYKNHISLLKSQGEIISLVPTMGNLHDGHLSLVEIAKKNSSKVITTIFINPLQFGEDEDFTSYPRTMNQDISKLKKLNCDILFAPKTKNEIFNNIDNLKNLKAGPKGNILCGKIRPGHFDGVLKVVYMLFQLTQPNLSVFGLKDFQQLYLIKRMAKIHFPKLKIISAPTIRNKNGLALSSRNSYLDEKSVKIAPLFYKILLDGINNLNKSNNIEETIKYITLNLEKNKFLVNYVSFLTTELEKIKLNTSKKKILLSSVKLGQTRLIDNIEFN